MTLNSKSILRNLIFAIIIFSVVLFFLFPKYEYIPKLIYEAVAIGFALWHAAQRNLRASFICGVGAVFILFTLPNMRVLKNAEIVLIGLIWLFAFYLHHRSKRKLHRESE